MITKLDNSDEKVANQIFNVFQRSYQVEAQIIGTLDFPPLFRSMEDIACSKTQFYGFIENECVAAIIETSIEEKYLDINSLTVEPNYFRKGIAGKLIRFILDEIEFSEAIVETAVVNLPAINLYKKHGFIEIKRWTPSHGIKKIALSVKSAL
jgi:ribosomal protein S18 acetylase RimI-like enzyme